MNIHLETGLLHNLLKYLLTGCAQAGHRSAMLLDQLADAPETDPEMRMACAAMAERLESQ